MGSIEELRKELDEIDKQRQELKKEYVRLGIKKIMVHFQLMQTPEARKAYKEAYRKVRYGK